MESGESARAPSQGLQPDTVEPEGPAFLARLRAGDEQAFESLVRHNSGRMLAVARRFLRNEEEARDALQDAFLSSFRSLDGFEEGSRLSTWLHRIVVNAALMKLRTRRRKPEQSIEELMPTFSDDGHMHRHPEPWREDAHELLERFESRAQVRSAIDRLPDDYRTVLLLRDIEEYDTDQTAELLGLSKGAVKTRLHRARQALRNLIDPHFRRGSP